MSKIPEMTGSFQTLFIQLLIKWMYYGNDSIGKDLTLSTLLNDFYSLYLCLCNLNSIIGCIAVRETMITAGFFHLLYKYRSIPGVASRSARYLRKVPRYTWDNRCCLKDLTFKVTPTIDMQHCH